MKKILVAALTPVLIGASQGPLPDVYLLMGQSNMSGRGALAELSPDDLRPDPRVMAYGNDGKLAVAVEPLDTAAGQIDAVSADEAAAVGPGRFFGRVMVRRSGHQVILVPCSKGGSSLDRWRPGGGRETLYGSCIARAREAAAFGRLAGALWYQGESDAKALSDASTWAVRLETMFAALRKDLNAPVLPVVVTVLADQPTIGSYPAWTAVQEAQRGLKVSCVTTAPATGLPTNADTLHLSAQAERTLGSRLASAMLQLQRTRDCRRNRAATAPPASSPKR